MSTRKELELRIEELLENERRLIELVHTLKELHAEPEPRDQRGQALRSDPATCPSCPTTIACERVGCRHTTVGE